MGTFTYMAPEQARGTELDLRADLFAIGVLLYEMVAGRPPFQGSTAADIVGAILFLDPEPLARAAAVPTELDRIVMNALRKDPAERYQTCALLLQDLRALARAMDAGDVDRSTFMGTGVAPTTSPIEPPVTATTHTGLATGAAGRPPRRRRARHVIQSLAVLPLMNRSGDAELDYFSDGLTESLINNLSQIPRLRVMARSTVFRYKGEHVDPQDVGRQLGVQAVLTGHVVERAGAFVVAAELVDVDDGSQLWGTALNRRVADGFALQAEMSEELANALRLRLSRNQRKRLGKQHTANADAYQLYLRGRYFLNDRTGDALKLARTLFERAVAEDSAVRPGARRAGGLLLAHRREPARLIRQQLDRAGARGCIQGSTAGRGSRRGACVARIHQVPLRMGLDRCGGRVQLGTGTQPGSCAIAPVAGDVPGVPLTVRRGARRDETGARTRSAVAHHSERHRAHPPLRRTPGRGHRASTEHVLQTNPRFAQARIDLALTRMARGELAAARTELGLAREILGGVSTIVLLEACCAAREGRHDDAQAAFRALRESYDSNAAGADDLAMLAAVLGEFDAALQWLTEACAQRAPFLGYVDVEPAMAPLLHDPACRALLRRHGFRADG